MRRIVVVGDLSSTNLGDPLLTQCCKYIVDKVLAGKNVPVSLFDIAGRKSVASSKATVLSIPKSRRTTIMGSILSELKPLFKWLIKDRKDFRKRLDVKGVDETTYVIAGGALLSSSLFYAFRLNEIVRVAGKNNGRVVFNSVGIEKSIHNFGLAKYVVRGFLKRKEVVAFSTRDHLEDIPYLTDRSEFYTRTADPGLFASETYNVKRMDAQIIGLSVISYQAYQSIIKSDKRAENVTSDYLITYWSSIIGHLRKKKLDFRILTNGGQADYEMARKLVAALGLDESKYLLPMPQTPLELVNQLSMFKMVIAHRLHACIISSSLNIPIIPLVWSDKVKVFAELIGNHFSTWPEQAEVAGFDKVISLCLDTHVDMSLLKEEAINYMSNSLKICRV